tara:strand:- start:205 stop:489 length:285 start_codon:yes stop_codon:yes gene_type:complete
MAQKQNIKMKEKEELLAQAEFVQKSLDWWEKEIEKASEEVSEIESNNSLSIEEQNSRIKRLQYLISKTDTEISILNDLEENAINFISNHYEQAK